MTSDSLELLENSKEIICCIFLGISFGKSTVGSVMPSLRYNGPRYVYDRVIIFVIVHWKIWNVGW